MAKPAKSGGISALEEARVRAEAAENVRAVEHSMMLEGQSVGKVSEMIEEETQRAVAELRRQRSRAKQVPAHRNKAPRMR